MADSKELPVLAIYQNADHVSGLVQQLFDTPLVTEYVVERQEQTDLNTSVTGRGSVEGEADIKAPFVARVDVAANLEGEASRGKVLSTGSRGTQSFVYSRAYYLNLVRKELAQQGMLTQLDGLAASQPLKPGQLIEFEAAFTPSGITTIMDVLTPDLVAAITEWLTKRGEIATFQGYSTHDAVKTAALAMNEKATSRGDLARSVTRAVQADFRQEKTREYYGVVGADEDQVTLVTICDTDHFVVDDEDRILDGVFRVLAKVASPIETDVPILRRNKLLRNVSPDGFDAMIDSMRATLSGTATKIGETQIDDLIDLGVESRVAGPSMRVIPLAIYS